MKILGIDIGSRNAGFLLEKRPADIYQFINSQEFTPFYFETTHEELTAIIELEPDLVLFEPSGYHYEVLIVQYLKRHDIPYRRCTGTRLANYRKSLGIAKADRFDALTIALYGFDKLDEKGAFVEECQLEEMRRLWIERDNLGKHRAALINKLKQYLIHEFPEVADFGSKRKWGQNGSELFRWLGGLEVNPKSKTRYDTLHNGGRIRTTIKGGRFKTGYVDREPTYGSGIKAYVKLLGKQLAEIETRLLVIESKISSDLQHPDFKIYMEVFDRLDFSQSLRAIWLTRIYPFERFLDENLKPITIERISAQGKPVTKHISLGQFKAVLGAGLTPNTSGTRGEQPTKHFLKRRGRKKGEAPETLPMGDKLCRKAFFMWVTRRIESKRSSGEFADQLYQKAVELKSKGKNIYQRSGNLHGYTVRILFRELVKSIKT